jgi:hypothetical protein
MTHQGKANKKKIKVAILKSNKEELKATCIKLDQDGCYTWYVIRGTSSRIKQNTR